MQTIISSLHFNLLCLHKVVNILNEQRWQCLHSRCSGDTGVSVYNEEIGVVHMQSPFMSFGVRDDWGVEGGVGGGGGGVEGEGKIRTPQ